VPVIIPVRCQPSALLHFIGKRFDNLLLFMKRMQNQEPEASPGVLPVFERVAQKGGMFFT
jgi:hypothetical protein